MKFDKADNFRIRPLRRMVQIAFLLITLWIGIEFAIFVSQLEKGGHPTISRPPGVEAFLPISALISLKYWILTGVFNEIHPSALVVLLIILATAILLKKGFCSWVCPVGWISELLSGLHKIVFGRRENLPRWLDYPLRSLKYLLMFFFVWAVFGQMNLESLRSFIDSPYNRVADIKMLKFFLEMSATTFWVLIILVFLSILIPYFWCRYLCPYGALLGALSWLSPFKIHRHRESCIDCSKCTRVCPSYIDVHKANAVYSDECHSCWRCVDACPVKDTLYFSITRRKIKLTRISYAVLIILFFVLGTALAQITGHWQNSISLDEYRYHIRHLNDSAHGHNRGQVSEYGNSRQYEQQLEK
ncbi:MAG: FeS-binding protein [candidate division Zixibacteria bacterium CG_4_9_14_3_um_filter_46_8]|nr:MAG: FeS-binding protein [candidate division Zixibacteria bacterium CG_4_9_14_3_um_filter_46_8]